MQKEKQRSTIYTHITKDRVTCTSLKTGSQFMSFGRVVSACSTSGVRRVYLVTNQWCDKSWMRKDVEVLTTSGTYSLSFVIKCMAARFHDYVSDFTMNQFWFFFLRGFSSCTNHTQFRIHHSSFPIYYPIHHAHLLPIEEVKGEHLVLCRGLVEFKS